MSDTVKKVEMTWRDKITFTGGFVKETNQCVLFGVKMGSITGELPEGKDIGDFKQEFPDDPTHQMKSYVESTNGKDELVLETIGDAWQLMADIAGGAEKIKILSENWDIDIDSIPKVYRE